jgi:hypothetical protein
MVLAQNNGFAVFLNRSFDLYCRAFVILYGKEF